MKTKQYGKQALLWLIRKNPSVDALLSLKGNAKVCVFTEPLWGIPHNLFAPFLTVYMYSLGIRDVEIGILLSVGFFFQMVTALLGGAITDKYGRRITSFVADMFAWTLPCILWAFSQNFWWFFAAAAANSLWQITNTAWHCLLVEDADKKKLVHIFNWIYISAQLSVFFAPIAGVLIDRHSLVPVMRILFMISAVLMSAKFILLYVFSTETTLGKTRIAETQGVSLLRMLLDYRQVLRQALRKPETVRILLLITLLSISQLISTNFFALYATQNLLLPEKWLAYFPILRAAVMLLFLFGLQHTLASLSIKKGLLIGLGCFIAGQAVLLNAPTGLPSLLLLYTMLDACAAALFLPRKDALLIQNVEPAERARVTSIIWVIMLAVTSPFGFITGKLSDMERRLPFVMNLCLFLLMGVIILTGRPNENAPDAAP